MNRIRIKLFLMLVVTLLMSIYESFISPVYAQGFRLEVSPAKVNIKLIPGETYIQTFRIGNYSGAKNTFYMYTQDFTVLDEKGSPTFLENQDPENERFSLSKWITLEKESIELEPNETGEVNVNINVPLDAESGGHYAAFFVQTEKPEQNTTTGVGAIGRIGSLILSSVPGAVEENIDLISFLTDKKIYWTENPTINITTEIKNEGNVHVIPTGAIFLTGKGNFEGKNIIFNEKQSASLPNSPIRLLTEEFTASKKGFIPPFGKVEMNLILKYGNQQFEKTAYNYFWLIPLKFVLIISLILLVLLFVIWRTIVSFRK